MMSDKEVGDVTPKGPSSCCSSHATTPTAHGLPTKLSLQSSWANRPMVLLLHALECVVGRESHDCLPFSDVRSPQTPLRIL